MKDCRAYSWSGLRYTDRRQHNYKKTKLAAEGTWGLRGLEAYECFMDVFFLDRIMRVAEASSEASLSEDEWHFAVKHLQRERLARSERVVPTRDEFLEFTARQAVPEGKGLTADDRAIIEQHVGLLKYFRSLQVRQYPHGMSLSQPCRMCAR